MQRHWINITVTQLGIKHAALETYLETKVRLWVWGSFIDREGYVAETGRAGLRVKRVGKKHLTVLLDGIEVRVRPYKSRRVKRAVFIEHL